MIRCKWCNLNNPKYIEYHDNEWCKPNFDDKYLLIVSQIYNFMTGFLGFEIYFLLIMLSIKYLGNITNIYVCYLLPVIPIILLLFPLNIKVMKKVKTSIIVYLILSIFIIIFGFCIFVFLFDFYFFT